MNKKMLLIGAIAAVVVIGGAAAYLISQNAGAPSSKTPTTESNSKAAATITYSDSGFSPSKITVKSGDTIAIKNTSSSDIQFDSDPHPVHTDDEELNAGAVAPGKTVTFTVTTKGTFGYHNHLNPGDTGTITVQ